jgi:hypothetical protein
MSIVKYAGTGLAFPSQTMYVKQDQPATVAPVVRPAG